MLDLILKDIQDVYSRENFFRIRRFLGEQVIFDGDFKFFDITITQKDTAYKLLHGLTFTPSDIILLSASGNLNYYFKYQFFTKDSIIISANGPVRIRFLAGKLKDQIRNQSDGAPFDFVAPGDVIAPASPGFVYGAVGAKTTGFWLTSEGIPSNIVGVPVLFGDGSVVLAAVGTEIEANYQIGIYQHEGQGINISQIGSFNITTGGPKRLSFSFPITYSSPNVQLACRLNSGDTQNLKVSLVLKGTSI